MSAGGAVDVLSLQDVATELDLHYMTVYRYVRLGLVDAEKVGGRWSVTRAALDTFIAAQDGDTSTKPGGASEAAKSIWQTRFQARALAGDHAGCWSVIEAALAGGAEPRDVLVEIVVPTMTSIGDRWEVGDLEIHHEHRATAVTTRCVGRLSQRFARRGPRRATVLLGSAPDDRHHLATAVLADLLRDVHLEVVELGAAVPVETYRQMVAETDELLAVCVSVSTDDLLDGAAQVAQALHADDPDLVVIIGGAAVRNRDHAMDLGSDHWAANGLELIEVLETLIQ